MIDLYQKRLADHRTANLDVARRVLESDAQSHIRRRGGNVTLGVTTLLHEAYLDISGREALAFFDRNRFMGYASVVTRR